MELNYKQKKQIKLQLKAHRHSRYKTNIKISNNLVLKNFTVLPNILRPEVMCALQLAQWLHFNNGLIKNKSNLDMGCGTGIQAIIMALGGAKRITCTDISDIAVKNTNTNVKKYKLQKLYDRL